MIDRILGAVLTLCLLAGGTVAIGSAMLDYDRRAEQVRAAKTPVVRLPTVTVIGKRPVEADTLARTDAVGPTALVLQ